MGVGAATGGERRRGGKAHERPPVRLVERHALDVERARVGERQALRAPVELAEKGAVHLRRGGEPHEASALLEVRRIPHLVRLQESDNVSAHERGVGGERDRLHPVDALHVAGGAVDQYDVGLRGLERGEADERRDGEKCHGAGPRGHPPRAPRRALRRVVDLLAPALAVPEIRFRGLVRVVERVEVARH